MEPTTKIIIAMLIAYVPFFWYWIAYIRRILKLTELEKRRRGHHNDNDHYWGE